MRRCPGGWSWWSYCSLLSVVDCSSETGARTRSDRNCCASDCNDVWVIGDDAVVRSQRGVDDFRTVWRLDRAARTRAMLRATPNAPAVQGLVDCDGIGVRVGYSVPESVLVSDGGDLARMVSTGLSLRRFADRYRRHALHHVRVGVFVIAAKRSSGEDDKDGDRDRCNDSDDHTPTGVGVIHGPPPGSR